MKFFIYRNSTVEPLFKGFEFECSGYGDISFMPQDSDNLIWFYLPTTLFNCDDLEAELMQFQSQLQFIISKTPTTKNIFVLTIWDYFSIKYEQTNHVIQNSIDKYNNFLYDIANENLNIKVIELRDFCKEHQNDLIDWKYYYMAQSIINPKLSKYFKDWFAKQMGVLKNQRKKCLILDLDNTLWGGILGEDGPEGIKLGDTYPGLPFLHFQQAILQMAKNGVILAICSKNNENDVLELWKSHPFILLGMKDVASYRINWVDKATNIHEISEELNIGLDSIIFIDDNPAERERVKQMLPMVEVPDFPKNIYELPTFAKTIYENYFKTYRLTLEDRNKSLQYKQNSERKAFVSEFKSIDEYLSSLEMTLDIFEDNSFLVSRIAQMTQKTNQFNLRTQRYEEKDIAAFIENNDLVFCLSVKDKFGDNGITVAVIITIKEKEAFIDSFLLSCRILGRGIEKAFLNYLLNLLVDKGVDTLYAQYIPTNKNKQTENFYGESGFQLDESLESGVKNYSIELNKKREIKYYYQFNLHGKNK